MTAKTKSAELSSALRLLREAVCARRAPGSSPSTRGFEDIQARSWRAQRYPDGEPNGTCPPIRHHAHRREMSNANSEPVFVFATFHPFL